MSHTYPKTSDRFTSLDELGVLSSHFGTGGDARLPTGSGTSGLPAVLPGSALAPARTHRSAGPPLPTSAARPLPGDSTRSSSDPSASWSRLVCTVDLRRTAWQLPQLPQLPTQFD